jgi:hypothetical protein
MDFTLQQGFTNYRMTVELIYTGDTVERYKVHARNNPDKYIILQNNRPLLRKKYFLQTKKLTWKCTEGTINNVTALNEVIKIIEDWIEPRHRGYVDKKGY